MSIMTSRVVNYLLIVGEYEKAEEYCKLLFNEILPIDRDYISKINSNLGLINHKKGNYDLALKYFVRAFEIRPNNKFISITSENNGDSEQAKEYFENSPNRDEYNSLLLNADTYSTIGLFYDSEETGQPGIGYIYSNIGLYYKQNKDYSTALINHKKTLEFELEIDHATLDFIYYHLGLVYVEIDDYVNGIKYLSKTFDIQTRTQQKILDYESALKHTQLALSYFYSMIADIYESFVVMYQENGDYDNVVLNLNKALDIQLNIHPQTYTLIVQFPLI
ncbi:unnamed protein product [Didymodactylos carnosus]|uniref:Tetratricopeptide repeat protein n=1 Tax=Didymodactylos carnosus TaxID=1234261 RepID=A0A815HDR5_9BILA|nr:unnamed protein product [Didymodactylos carnosus]CAF1352602.1 unnamed protein product [Didymodactylos carnosus]CAF3602720.1 unnamed protein product [Didymodactylos carnosus]CAF4223911.1 unnamed protein product [Didymodactylos carnosus]